MSTQTQQTQVTSEGRLFYCPKLGKWFSVEAIDADPRLSLLKDDTVDVVEPANQLVPDATQFAN